MEPIVNEGYLQSFVFNSKSPFSKEELKETLAEENYSIIDVEKIKQGPFIIQNSNIKIAKKNDCDIVYNSEVGTLFVGGKDWEKVNEEFFNLKNILINKLEINMDDVIKSFELVSQNQINTGKERKSSEIINDYYNCIDVKSNFNEILGYEGSFNTIRIIPKGKNQTSANWYDIVIESISTRFLGLRLVYRNKDIEKFEKISENIEEIISKIVGIIGGK